IAYITSPTLRERTFQHLHFSGRCLSLTRRYAHLPVLPPSIVAACQGQIHAFDSQDLIDVYIPDGPETVLYCCEQQPCPNRTPRLIEKNYPHYKAIRRAQHLLGPRSTLASQSASRHSRPVSPTSRLPQTVADQARGDLPPDPAPEPEPEEGDSEEGVSESESADPARPASPTALTSASAIPDRRATTAASAPATSSVPPNTDNVVPCSRPQQGDFETSPPTPIRWQNSHRMQPVPVAAAHLLAGQHVIDHHRA
ncbi:hypothetical protein POSPLADRAFT_1158544, partial [Postia placenta MAD-698-R-SB12]